MDPDVNSLMSFLKVLFDEQLSYSSINAARSAVSSFSLHKKVLLGSHPLISRFLKGVFNLRPALPKSSVTWDTAIVLNFLKKWHPARNLDLLQLSVKVVILCLLVTGQRGQTVHKMDLRNMAWPNKHDKEKVVTCSFGDPLKTTNKKNHQKQLTFEAYPHDKALCVVHYLQEYVKRTENLRGEESSLFITSRPPHKGVARSTIAQWTKKGLAMSGIDTAVFTPHSTRAASTSKAVGRVCLDTILKTAGWRRSSTFGKFYHKEITSSGLKIKDLL